MKIDRAYEKNLRRYSFVMTKSLNRQTHLLSAVFCFLFSYSPLCFYPLPPFSLMSPSSKSYVWPCVCPQHAPSPARHSLDLRFFGGRWRGRRVTHLMTHSCTIGWTRQIGSQCSSSLLDEYFLALLHHLAVTVEKARTWLACVCATAGELFRRLHWKIMWLLLLKDVGYSVIKRAENTPPVITFEENLFCYKPFINRGFWVQDRCSMFNNIQYKLYRQSSAILETFSRRHCS